jgi:DNA-binding NarL/FixJ family response regulator
MAHRVPVVAILNSNDDIVEMLRTAIEATGMVVVSTHVDDVRRGESSLSDFIAEHEPEVVIYDLVPPYDRSWMFLNHIREMPSMRNREWVLTSVNPKRALEHRQGSDAQVLEILGKPIDIGEITQAVREAAKARPVRG